MKKTVFIILLLFLGFNKLPAQFFTNETNNRISMSFHHSKIESAANSSIFNILTVKNNTNKPFNGKLEFTQPADWKIVGVSEIKVNIPAYDSIKMPLRIIVSKDVVGEVGYAVIANLFDENKKPFISEYCFVTIPRVSSMKIKFPRNVIYFDNKTETAEFNYQISNKGNTNENVQISIRASENLSIESNKLDKLFAYEYNISAHNDTIVGVKIKLENQIKGIDSYKTDVLIYTQDSVYKSNVWLFKVDNLYNHKIPNENKCAIIEITASDVLSKYNPTYSLMAKGSILFKRNLDFNYFFYKNNINSSWEDNYYDTRFYLELRNNYFKLRAGTVESFFNEYIYGLGGQLEIYHPSKKLTVSGFYSHNENSTQTAYGTGINYRLSKGIGLILGYAQNNFEQYKNYTQILMSGINFSFLKRNQISLVSYMNKTKHALSTPFTKEGIGLLSNYMGNFNKLRASAHIEYGSPQYSGRSKGKLIANANINYQLSGKDYLNLSYFKNDVINSYYINNVYQPEKKIFYDAYKIDYNRRLTKYLSVQAGPLVRFEKFNVPYVDTLLYFYFKTYSPRLYISARYSKYRSKLYMKPSFDVGNIFVINALDIDDSKTLNYTTYNFNFNAIYKDFNLYITYRNGPYSIYQQYYYYNSDYFTKWLFFMPSYNKFFFKRKLNLDLRSVYRLDLNNRNNSINFTSQAIILIAKTWTLRLLQSFSTYAKHDAINNTTLRYNSSYFEIALRKEFNCKQPRFQYHNLKVLFFRDLNGDRVKQPNEPGLRNVLAHIEPNYKLEDSKIEKDFVATRLLTGPDGLISYNNIVNGEYLIKYSLIGDMVGNFSREEQTHLFSINDDKTIYIPYLENNRVVGKVILNRDPLSGLGEINISNIRVIAEDTKGHTYSALTDKKGNFIIYAPVTDHYVVRINNIFYESFDLQQEEFIVKFNGYKQFDVAFVFNEKKRKINFSENETIPDEGEEEQIIDDIKAIRKTILSGKIRDVISLKPIGATVKIINNANDKEISSSASNKITGNYSITYAEGKNYRIEVVAKGYIKYVENLYIEQVISIQNISKNIMLTKVIE